MIIELREKLAYAEGKLEAREEEIKHLQETQSFLMPSENQPSENSMGQLLKKLKVIPVLTQEVIEKLKGFFQAKDTFLNTRRETINDLKKCFNELEKFIDEKHARFEIAEIITNSTDGVPVLSTVFRILGGAIKVTNNYSKIKFFSKRAKSFKSY